MLPLTPSGSTVTTEQVRRALLFEGGSREVEYRFDIVDRQGAYLADGTDIVTSASVENNSLAEIKRTAKFSIIESDKIDLTRDFIRPRVLLAVGDETVEWPLGVFSLSSPTRVLETGQSVTRDIDAFDLLVLLSQRLVDKRYTVAANDRYTDAISSLIGDVPKRVVPSSSRLRVAMEWDPGTPVLTILNDLLAAINYRSMTADALGIYVAEPYVIPAERVAEFTYDTGLWSVIGGEPTHELDLFSVPNQWIVIQSDPEVTPLRSVYTNRNPDSPTSTVSRGRVIGEYIEAEAADQKTLDDIAKRAASEASQVYEEVTFETAIMPMHADSDVYRITLPELGIDAPYSEHAWSFNLEAGADMKHQARRVVSV